MLFGGSNPPLGGPGYLDPMTIIGVFTVAFGDHDDVLDAAADAHPGGIRARGAEGASAVGLRETAAASDRRRTRDGRRADPVPDHRAS